MTTEENTKTLYGNVNLNDYYFEWHSEPGACEKCQALDGKTFDDANTIPDKPHPNCKCWIERKKYPSSDPIQQRRDKIQEQKDLELEFEKLKGDLRCLEAECDKSIEIIDNELDTIEQVEYTINPEYLKPLDVEKIQEVKQALENNKQEVIKAQISINEYKNNSTSDSTIRGINYWEYKIGELKAFIIKISQTLNNLNIIKKSKKFDKVTEQIKNNNEEKFETYTKPVSGKITSEFGYRTPPTKGASSGHSGIDIAVDEGTPVKVIAAGTVTAARSGMRGYGTGIFVDHGIINNKHVVSEYGHLSKFYVKVGDKVSAGQVIGESGNTGISTGPHLHLTIREDNVPVNPRKYLTDL